MTQRLHTAATDPAVRMLSRRQVETGDAVEPLHVPPSLTTDRHTPHSRSAAGYRSDGTGSSQPRRPASARGFTRQSPHALPLAFVGKPTTGLVPLADGGLSLLLNGTDVFAPQTGEAVGKARRHRLPAHRQ